MNSFTGKCVRSSSIVEQCVQLAGRCHAMQAWQAMAIASTISIFEESVAHLQCT